MQLRTIQEEISTFLKWKKQQESQTAQQITEQLTPNSQYMQLA